MSFPAKEIAAWPAETERPHSFPSGTRVYRAWEVAIHAAVLERKGILEYAEILGDIPGQKRGHPRGR